jgi:hypothetical protein
MAEDKRKYTHELKIEVAKYGKTEGIKNSSAFYNIPRNTVSRWLKKFTLSGVKGLVTKRNDTQKTKLDSRLTDSILRYKKKNPKATLAQLKDHFGLECSVSLISKKLLKKSNKLNNNIQSDKRIELQYADLLKKAVMYYDTDNCQTALKIFKDVLKRSSAFKNKEFAAEASLYTGIIHNIFHDIKKALKYLENASQLAKAKDNPKLATIFYRAKYISSIIKKDYENAVIFSEFYLKNSLETKDKKTIGKCMGSSCQHLYFTNRYDDYLKALHTAKEYNIDNENYHEVCSDLLNIMNVYCCKYPENPDMIETIRDDLNKYSEMIKTPLSDVEANYRTGIQLYKQGELDEAEKILEKTLCCRGKFDCVETRLSNLCYLSRIYYDKRDYSKAVRKLNLLYKESGKCGSEIYMIEATRLLSYIFLSRQDMKRAVKQIKLTISLAEKLNNNQIAGKFHYLYGSILKVKKYFNEASSHYKKAINHYKLHSEETDTDNFNIITVIKLKLENLYYDYDDRYEINAKLHELNKLRNLRTAFFFYHNLLNLYQKNGEGYEESITDRVADHNSADFCSE